MASFTDRELLRIVGMALPVGQRVPFGHTAQCDRVLIPLRRAIRLKPTTGLVFPPSTDWLRFITAIVAALSHTPTADDSFVSSDLIERAIVQIANLQLHVELSGVDTYKLIDAAKEKCWLEGQYFGPLDGKFRATLLGERTVEGEILKIRPTAAERWKQFRGLFLRYLEIARSNHVDVIKRATALHHDLQDAWCELVDLVIETEGYKTSAIQRIVECRHIQEGEFNDDPFGTAADDLNRLIINAGIAERLAAKQNIEALDWILQQSADESLPEPLHTDNQYSKPIVPAAETNTSNAQDSNDGLTEPIQYITRDAAAAMCGVSKGTIERWFSDDIDAPEPVRQGGGGKRHEYDYRTLRPWLVKHCGRPLSMSYDANLLR